ncbi:MAG: cupin domain-containing protein [Thiotrichales bacterium]
MKIVHWDLSEKTNNREESLKKSLKNQGYWVNRRVYQPGTIFPEHSNNVDTLDAIVSGQLRLSIQGESVVLGSGDVVSVPRGAMHCAEVIGDEPVVALDAIRLSAPNNR